MKSMQLLAARGSENPSQRLESETLINQIKQELRVNRSPYGWMRRRRRSVSCRSVRIGEANDDDDDELLMMIES